MSSNRKTFVLWYAITTIAFLCSCQAMRVTGTSMLPNIRDGGMVFSLGYPWGPVHRGDIVRVDVINPETNLEQVWIKRIIGMPGEVVEVNGDAVKIDGEILDEPYLEPGLHNFSSAIRVVYLKDNEYWVMGDNRPISFDSRGIGPVKKSQILDKLGWYFQIGGKGWTN